MTTNANSPDAAPDMPQVIVEYEAATPSLGGSDAAEFQIRRYSHATLECALYLALDARQAFEARCGALTDAQAQLLLRALAADWYPAYMASGAEPPAIVTLRARDLSDQQMTAAIAAAGLPTLSE